MGNSDAPSLKPRPVTIVAEPPADTGSGPLASGHGALRASTPEVHSQPLRSIVLHCRTVLNSGRIEHQPADDAGEGRALRTRVRILW